MYSPNQNIDIQKTKLAKVLAVAGIASRRKAEELIFHGRVSVNGVVEHNVATRVQADKDFIEVDGKPLPTLEQPQHSVVLVLHKPAGYVSTVSDPDGKPTVMDFIPKEYMQYRLYPVGRLDEESEGLILLTNKGDLAYRLTHPKFEVPKKYLVWIDGKTTLQELERLREGIWLKEQGFKKRTQPAIVEILEESSNQQNQVLSVIITEGIHRQVRRMFRAVNHEVIRLKRVTFGEYQLGDLEPGKMRVEQDVSTE